MKILFMAEAVTLAHVARPIALATGLLERGYEVVLASDPRFDSFIGQLPFKKISLASMDSEYFIKNLEKGRFPYDQEIICSYIAEDLKILNDIRPDIVVGDFRLSLMVSARVAQIPYYQLINGYWGPSAAVEYPIPEFPFVKYLGVPVSQFIFNLTKDMVSSFYSLRFNRQMRAHSLPSVGSDLRYIYTAAEQVLYCDVPEIIPMKKQLSKHEHFIGAVHWSPKADLPDWWGQIPKDKPIVFVSLGSSGTYSIVSELLKALLDLPIIIIFSGQLPAGVKSQGNLFSSVVIPNKEGIKIASLVIGNGGSPASYMALAHGVPYLGFPANLDQYLSSYCTKRIGATDYIRSGQAKAPRIREVVLTMLSDSKYKERASEYAAIFGKYNAIDLFEKVLLESNPSPSS